MRRPVFLSPIDSLHSPMALPTIVFVHGAWHQPPFFDKVKRILNSKGYRTVALALPSVGRNPPVTSFDEDIAVVREAVLKELDSGNDVVVNAHSMSTGQVRSREITD